MSGPLMKSVTCGVPLTLAPPLPGNFPPPTTPEELGARILIQERYEKFGESEEVEMEVESDEEDEKQDKTEEPPSQLDQDTQVQDMDEVWWGAPFPQEQHRDGAGLGLWAPGKTTLPEPLPGPQGHRASPALATKMNS